MHRGVAHNSSDFGAALEVDALSCVAISEELRKQWNQRAGHQAGLGFDYCYMLPQSTRHRSDFEPDKPASDDYYVVPSLKALLEHRGFIQGTQVTDALQLRAVDGQQPVTCSRGQHQRIELDARARAQ